MSRAALQLGQLAAAYFGGYQRSDRAERWTVDAAAPVSFFLSLFWFT
jgi:hypothetical protein